MSSDRGKTAAYRDAMTAICHQQWSIVPDKSTHRRDKNEQWLENLHILREQVQAKVDEDEILLELRQDCKHVLCRSLCPPRHGVVSIVLESNTAEQK